MSNFIDLTGQVFSRLTVLARSGTNKFKRPMWLCRCSCGVEKEVDGQNLRNGSAKSCGCFNREQRSFICIKRNTTHGLRKKRVYKLWSDMKSRCNNPKTKKFPIYGGRGIRVCERWELFENFFEDMGHPPSDKHSLDRIDVNGMYEKDNCRWVLPAVQQNNRTNNRLVTCNGVTKTLQQWAEHTGIPRKTISNRIARGWPVERALGKTT